ncbi:hypothetical protein ACIPVK_19935 [Paeniglutamicibacter sp. MACA_103]|uniref:hypothetical protein n=1 Tax=Paeniglutamicibacter sp. MACA_103 TaxID=3377337 RepID=UPI003894A9EB
MNVSILPLPIFVSQTPATAATTGASLARAEFGSLTDASTGSSVVFSSDFVGASALGVAGFLESIDLLVDGASDVGAADSCASASSSSADGSVPWRGASAAVSSGVAAFAFAGFDPALASPPSTASSNACSTLASLLSDGDAAAGLNPPPPNIIVATSAVVALAATVERTIPFLQMASKKELRRAKRRPLN